MSSTSASIDNGKEGESPSTNALLIATNTKNAALRDALNEANLRVLHTQFCMSLPRTSFGFSDKPLMMPSVPNYSMLPPFGPMTNRAYDFSPRLVPVSGDASPRFLNSPSFSWAQAFNSNPGTLSSFTNSVPPSPGAQQRKATSSFE